MAQTISISIRDELWSRFQAVKERFNVSRVCQTAIEREIERHELILQGTEDMEKVIQRLRMEKKETEKYFEDKGFRDGYRDAKVMRYVTLNELAKSQQSQEESDLRDDWDSECIRNLFDAYLEDLEKTCAYTAIGGDYDCLYDEDEDVPGEFNEEEYLTGWLKGVIAFWNEVKDKI